MDTSKLRLEDLQYKGLKIYQDKDLYCFTSDAVMLANFAKVKCGEKVADFCAGGGIIAILLAAKNKPQSIVAVEIQNQMAELARLNVELNDIPNIVVENKSIQDYVKEIEAGAFDVIVCNPPYKRKNLSYKNENDVKSIARHEIFLDLETLIECVSRSLKFGGRFYVSFDANRVAELLFTLKKHGVEPKRMFFTQPAADKNATLVFVEAARGGKEEVVVLPTLITNDQDGTYVQNIIDNYKRR